MAAPMTAAARREAWQRHLLDCRRKLASAEKAADRMRECLPEEHAATFYVLEKRVHSAATLAMMLHDRCKGRT